MSHVDLDLIDFKILISKFWPPGSKMLAQCYFVNDSPSSIFKPQEKAISNTCTVSRGLLMVQVWFYGEEGEEQPLPDWWSVPIESTLRSFSTERDEFKAMLKRYWRI